MSDSEVERRIRKAVARQLHGRGVSLSDKHRIVATAKAAFGRDSAFLAFQKKLAVLWGKPTWQFDAVGVILKDAVEGVAAAGVTPDNCEHAAYVAIASVHNPISDFEEEWKALYARFSKVPLDYVEGARVLASGEAICDRQFLWSVTEAWEAGVEQAYIHVVPLSGRRASLGTEGTYPKPPAFGYSPDEVVRIQESGLAPAYARYVFYEEPSGELAVCLKWAEAGVPLSFAHQMYANGVPSKVAIGLYVDGVPLEYAGALGGAA